MKYQTSCTLRHQFHSDEAACVLVLIAVGLVLAFVLPLALAVTAVVALGAELTPMLNSSPEHVDDSEIELTADCIGWDAMLERCLLDSSNAERRFDMVNCCCLHCMMLWISIGIRRVRDEIYVFMKWARWAFSLRTIRKTHF